MYRRYLPFIVSLCQMFPCPDAHAEALTFSRVRSMWHETNFDLKLAQHAVRGAAGDRAVADRRENPTLSLGATSLSPRAGLGAGGLRDKNADSVVRLEQIVERGDKRVLRTRGAEARLAASEADAAETERAGLIQLNATYWDLKAAEDRERLTESAARLAKDAVVAAERRLAAGDVAAVDVSRFRVEALRAENDARLATSDRQKAQLALALTIGRDQSAPAITCADEWPSVDPGAFLPAPGEDLIEQRSDVRAAKLRLDAAESALAGARSLTRRDVTVGLQFEHYPTTGDLPPNNTWGISVSVPLFASHTYEGEILRASAELDQARDLVARARATALAEARKAFADLQSAQDRLQRLQADLLPEAGKVAAAAELAYRKGAVSLLELLDARRSMRQAQLDALAARGDFAKAVLAMRLQFPTAGNP